ncbi:hypothetical protein ACSU1N_02350 [Thermogladius sp. 4427co]|uniref:hypothetical protein n=1 Tax=Thermogladius sp. 4427co TaxID=3450718 RepID=UPI003F78F8AE
MVVIGNKTNLVQIPVQGNTILLDKVDPGYWTVVVSDPDDLNKLAYALNTGYKLSATLSGTSDLWYTHPFGTIEQETMMLQQYLANPAFIGRELIVMKNETLIPWGFMLGADQYSYAGKLNFILQAGSTGYS